MRNESYGTTKKEKRETVVKRHVITFYKQSTNFKVVPIAVRMVSDRLQPRTYALSFCYGLEFLYSVIFQDLQAWMHALGP